MPTVLTTLPVVRYILLREKITVVHGHSVCLSLLIFLLNLCFRSFSVATPQVWSHLPA